LPEGSFDLIASNMSLHHIADKGTFYKRLHDAMRPGGSFILGDELTGAMSRIRELNWNGWLEFASREGHLSAEEIARIVLHEREFDHYETLPDQIDLLRGAGFDSVDCVWRYLIYGVFVALA
jgi:tRNA (cmo5U34)-methyltransferase